MRPMHAGRQKRCCWARPSSWRRTGPAPPLACAPLPKGWRDEAGVTSFPVDEHHADILRKKIARTLDQAAIEAETATGAAFSPDEAMAVAAAVLSDDPV